MAPEQSPPTEDEPTGPETRASEHYLDEKTPRSPEEPTWGASVTSIVGPTPETEAAVDTDAPRVQERHEGQEQVQAAILAVAASHGGTHSRAIVRDALQRELEARGRWPQPEPWLDAVASEIEGGGVYNVGTDRQDGANRDDDQRD